MTATKSRRKATRKTPSARPVAEVLLELAYHLHTTRVVARRQTADSGRVPAMHQPRQQY